MNSTETQTPFNENLTVGGPKAPIDGMSKRTKMIALAVVALIIAGATYLGMTVGHTDQDVPQAGDARTNAETSQAPTNEEKAEQPRETPAPQAPAVDVEDASVVAEFGPEATAVIGTEMDTFASATIANMEVATNKYDIGEMVETLPLEAVAIKAAQEKPDLLFVDTINAPEQGQVFAEPFVEYKNLWHYENSKAVPGVLYSLDTTTDPNGLPLVKVEFTAEATWFYNQTTDGTTTLMAYDAQRDYTLFLTPNSDSEGTTWNVMYFNTSFRPSDAYEVK